MSTENGGGTAVGRSRVCDKQLPGSAHLPGPAAQIRHDAGDER